MGPCGDSLLKEEAARDEMNARRCGKLLKDARRTAEGF